MKKQSSKHKITNHQNSKEGYCACALETEIVERVEENATNDSQYTPTVMVCFELLHDTSCVESAKEHMYS